MMYFWALVMQSLLLAPLGKRFQMNAKAKFSANVSSEISANVSSEDSLSQRHVQALLALTGTRLGDYVLLHSMDKAINASRNTTTASGRLSRDAGGKSNIIPPDQFTNARYRLGDLLGTGSFGAAFAANHVSTNDLVVLKFIYTFYDEHIHIVTGADQKRFSKQLQELAEECDELDKVQRAKAVDAVGAQHLVTCRGKFFEGTGAHFIVMDHAGENGLEWMEAHQDDKAAMAAALQQVALGLAYLTKSIHPPLIHHDLKWDNVAVRTTGSGIHLRLIDFGASMEATAAEWDTHKSVCTEGYAPPEWSHGYAYVQPAYSFDIYSLGAMALEALCDVPYSHVKWIGEKAVASFSYYPEFNVDLLGLNSLGAYGSRLHTCSISLAPLMQQTPLHRAAPDAVRFFDWGMTTVATYESHVPAVGSLNSEPMHGFVLELKQALTKVTRKEHPEWHDVVLSGNVSRYCMDRVLQHLDSNYYEEYIMLKSEGLRQALAVLREKESEEAAVKVLDSLWHFLWARGNELSVARQDGQDVDVVACLLKYAEARGMQYDGSAAAGLAFLQWSAAIKRLRHYTPAGRGDQFVHGLVYAPLKPAPKITPEVLGVAAEHYLQEHFHALLTNIQTKAYNLYKAAGEAAVPSFKSKVSTFFSQAVDAAYRKFYRKIFYIVNAHLQQAAAMVACAAARAAQGQNLARALFIVGHLKLKQLETGQAVYIPGNILKDSTQGLKVQTDAAQRMQEHFVDSSDYVVQPLPAWDTYDDLTATVWNAAKNMSYKPRQTSTTDFLNLWKGFALKQKDVCTIPNILRTHGVYSAFRSHVGNNMLSALAALDEVLEERVQGKLVRHFRIGSSVQQELQAASEALALFAKSKGAAGYARARMNVDNIKKSVLEKLYHGSDDAQFDDMGNGY